jgi:hypothetical protein
MSGPAMGNDVIEQKNENRDNNAGHEYIVGNFHQPEFLGKDLPKFILIFQQCGIEMFVIFHHFLYRFQVIIILKLDEIPEKGKV